MSLTILTPLAALLALLAAVPIAALLGGEARARDVARALGLPGAASSTAAVAAVATLAVLLGLAASQPVLALDSEQPVRADAELYVVLDTTRSMLAARANGAPTRFDRAKEVALRLRAELDDVPVGLASFTDRVLPHLFPSPDGELYAAALARSIQVEHPPPEHEWAQRATTFEALAALATRNFYTPSATTRVFVLLTDGETQAYSIPALAAVLQRPPAIVPIAVHVRRDGEQLYLDGQLDRGYRTDPASARALEELAAATGGAAVAEDDIAGLVRVTREALGDGELAAQGSRRATIPLAPWLALLAALPLAFLVARRNL